MGDLLIRGGVVVDGTGQPGRRLDVRVRGGRIAEMAPGLEPSGEQVIEAAGAVVTPGFIDSHTHYDAAIYWDPLCDPMPQHGVTTVVIGNCALGLAPLRPADRAAQLDVFSYIEDLPLELLNEAIPWSWESFADYARTLAEKPLGVNLMVLASHSQIRAWVMGEAAWTRTATAEESAAMAVELDRALAAGAFGLSISSFDKDRQGRAVPSSIADAAELDALGAVLARHGAVLQFVPCSDTTEMLLAELERLGAVLGRHGVAGLYNILVHVNGDPSRSAQVEACLKGLHAQGVRLYAMAAPRPFELSIGFEQTICFISVPAWNELVQAEPAAKRRLVADPVWRARARADVDNFPSVMFPFDQPQLLRIRRVAGPAQAEWAGRSFGELIAARGGHPSDVLADWVAENDFAATFIFPIANTDEAEVAALLKSPVAFVSGSDAGAHLQMFCAAGDATLLLTRFVRERGDLSLEAAVHAVTGRQAEIFGLGDRGVLAPGKAGDIAVFALDELSYGAEFAARDLPGGRERLTRAPGGYRYTIVGGVVVQAAGVATGELPARYLAHRG